MNTQETRPPPERRTVQDDRLLRRRMGAALLEGDAESGSATMSRLGAGSIAGVLVTIAVVAVVGVIAILRPGGSTAWQESGAFIVADETGTRYIYREGVLSPVVNYASAKLLLGNELHVVSVSTRSLASAPQGPAIGIAMAPDSLPDAAGMVGTDWSACATGSPAQRLQASLHPGWSAAGESLGADDAFLMRTEQGRNFLIRATHAHEIADRWLPALGYLQTDTLPVAAAFVAALPEGEPIAPPEISSVGQPGQALPGTSEQVPIGTIFADRSNTHYVMTQNGLAGLTPLQASLLLADPRLSPAYAGGSPSALPITAAQVTGSAVAPLPATGAGTAAPAPTAAPALATWPAGEQQLCLQIADDRAPGLVIGPAEQDGRGAASPDGLLRLPTGRGALAAGTPAPDGGVMTVYLVTDSGVRYPIAGQQSLEQLGLAGVSIARVPSGVLDLLPIGPTLDAAAAALPVS